MIAAIPTLSQVSFVNVIWSSSDQDVDLRLTEPLNVLTVQVHVACILSQPQTAAVHLARQMATCRPGAQLQLDAPPADAPPADTPSPAADEGSE